MAEKIASNILMNRLDPHYSDSDSSSASDSESVSEEEEEADADYLHPPLETTQPLLMHGAATVVTVEEGETVGNGTEGVAVSGQLPQVTVQEGTPAIIATSLPVPGGPSGRKLSATLTARGGVDTISFASAEHPPRRKKKRKGSDRKRKEQQQKHPMRYAAAGMMFAGYSPTTLRAIQAVEAAKIRGNKTGDFK